jgi:putative SOS response-associated peptidase YedK
LWVRGLRSTAPGTIISPMCGRYASFLPAEALARIFGTVNPLPNIDPSWNLAPTQPSLVVRRHPETGARHLNVLK